MNILNIIISSILIYGCSRGTGWGLRCGLGLTISRYIGAAAIIGVLMTGMTPSLRLTLKSYFRPLNFAIIWEVMGIGIPPVSNRCCLTAVSCSRRCLSPEWGPTLSPGISLPFQSPH
jgi:Na+-driven multidrug efflux pump